MAKVKVLLLNEWYSGNLLSNTGIIKLTEMKKGKDGMQLNEDYLYNVQDNVTFRADPDLIELAFNWPSVINADFRIIEIELPDGISIDDSNLTFKDTEHLNPAEELVYEFSYEKILDKSASYP